MDSLSQAVLGSAVALAVSRGQRPRQAIMIGAALATLPDLDVLIPFENDLDAMTRHRSWTHSWLVHILVAPLFALLLGYVNRNWDWINRLMTCFLVLITHSALDALTIYGTWLFWPFGSQPVMGGSIFIIDPIYTIPLLIGVVWIWRHPASARVMTVTLGALSVSSLYLCWGLLSKNHIETLAYQTLANNGIYPQHLVATPTPFNSILWRVIAIDQNRFHEGYYSYVSPDDEIPFRTYDRGLELIETIKDREALNQFAGFNHGFHAFSAEEGRILGQDLRMGAEPFYFFQFEFAYYPDFESNAPAGKQAPLSMKPMESSMEIRLPELFGWIGKRLFDRDLVPLDSIRNMRPDSSSFRNNAVKL